MGPEDKKAQTPRGRAVVMFSRRGGSCGFWTIRSTLSFKGMSGEGEKVREKSNSWVFSSTALIKGPVCSIIRGMGCATETACGLQNLTILENAKIETFCSSESPPLRSFSSALTCLFLIKALL